MNTQTKAIIEDGEAYDISFSNELLSAGTVNNKEFIWDVSKLDEKHFSIIKNNKSYQVEILKADHGSKSFFIKVDGKIVKLKLEDRYDALLHKLGMDDLASSKVSSIKAPMPGLVLNINIKVDQSVKKGDAVVVLEAMKMENVLKSPTDGEIKSIHVKKGDAVEKNQLLVEFK